MYCHRCGNNLTNESLFCNRCGAKIQPAAETRRPPGIQVPLRRPIRRPVAIETPSVADTPEENNDEDIIFRITPAFYEVGISYSIAALLSLTATIAIAYFKGPVWMALIFAATFFVNPIYRHIQQSHIVYTLTSIKIEIETGIFSKTVRNIPLRHIQDVSINETFKERMIGIGDVFIDSAAMEGKITMNNISNPRKYADLILSQLQRWN